MRLTAISGLLIDKMRVRGIVVDVIGVKARVVVSEDFFAPMCSRFFQVVGTRFFLFKSHISVMAFIARSFLCCPPARDSNYFTLPSHP